MTHEIKIESPPGFSLGPPVRFAPVVRAPWLFPYQAGIAGYVRALDGQSGPTCLITGKPIERDGNTGIEIE